MRDDRHPHRPDATTPPPTEQEDTPPMTLRTERDVLAAVPDGCLIDGVWRPTATVFDVHDPATGDRKSVV